MTIDFSSHNSSDLGAFQMGCTTFDQRVVRAFAEVALSALWTSADAVAGQYFPAFVTEPGVCGSGASVRVRSSQGVKGVFVGEDTPE